MNLFKSYLISVFEDWEKDANEKALKCHEKNKEAAILDLGCGNGDNTLKFIEKIKSNKKPVGIELTGLKVQDAIRKGIDCRQGSLEKQLPFEEKTFDIIISNFLLDHLLNIDLFISEAYRVLKPGGYMVISTDNLSSWPSIASLILGFQPFTLDRGLTNKVLGNPLSCHHGDYCNDFDNNLPAGFNGHIKVLAYQALKELIEYKGFVIENLTGAGYLFFKGKASSLFSKIDPRHSYFIIIKARKPIIS